ncbi:MAG TPA: hypothetical protein VMM56_14755 [Planctomycetaceae bacterium]|nr:hypothetical protein [Planctomycetaceae bacterium]
MPIRRSFRVNRSNLVETNIRAIVYTRIAGKISHSPREELTYVTDDLVFDCLMCGTPLLIREQDRNERLQCPVCGEIMLSTDRGMQVDPGEQFDDPPKRSLFSLYVYGPILVFALILAVVMFFFTVCYVTL